jgi:long-chain acyl-CoA synthetase
MTETAGMVTAQGVTEVCVPKSVGSPSVACEIKLVKCNDYDPNANPPRGEIWVRGNNIMKGYYKQPKITAETLTEDGWLMTGDIGEWREDGSLSIIDRKKNLVKLAHGEYVALEKLEAQYKASRYVLNMCIHADPLESMIVALIVPERKALLLLQKEFGIAEDDIHHSKLIEAIGKDLIRCAHTGDFKGAEILKTFKILDEEWTPENGMLTAAQKIKRKDIVQAYQHHIDDMYGKRK